MAKQQILSYNLYVIKKKNRYNHLPCTASCVALSPEVLGLDSRCPNKQKSLNHVKTNQDK